MAGLFDTLSLGSRSLETYRKAIDTTGHNLANVNTPGFSRQRLAVESVTTTSDLGPVGAGAEAAAVLRLQSQFLQRQLQIESSVEGSLSVKEEGLRQALTALQETIDRNDPSGTATRGISQKLSEFFAAMQSLSTNPSSIPERQVALQKAQELAAEFNRADARLGGLERTLNDRIESDVTRANALLSEIAGLNRAIVGEEALSEGYANDLRDARELKLEQLSSLVKIEAAEQDNGAVNVVIAGVTFIDGIDVTGSLQAFDPGNGRLLVRQAGGAAALTLTGGSLEGASSVRDGQIASVRSEIDALASVFISEVNQAHAGGFSLTGSTGAKFFEGTGSSNIAVNSTLLGNPGLLQASAQPGAAGDNAVALALARLGAKTHGALNGQSFSDKQTQIAASLGQELATARRDLEDQQAISRFARNQRDSVSAVSVDEEMANLVMFQKAFQASAKLITLTDEMLATIIGM